MRRAAVSDATGARAVTAAIAVVADVAGAAGEGVGVRGERAARAGPHRAGDRAGAREPRRGRLQGGRRRWRLHPRAAARAGATALTADHRARRAGRAGLGPGRPRATASCAGRVASLPGLPIALPQPDFCDVDAIKVPGVGTVDLRPALEALIQPRALPNVDLLSVGAAHSEASAQCVSGVPRFRGSSSLASVAVNGVELGPRQRHDRGRAADRLAEDRPVGHRRLEDRPAARRQPRRAPGRAAADPRRVARTSRCRPRSPASELTPNERVESGTRLSQRALHAVITIAGQQLADVVVGESTVGHRRRELRRRRRPRAPMPGAPARADRRLPAGRPRAAARRRRPQIRRQAHPHPLHGHGKTVARPRVRRDGTFRATAPLPDARIRDTSKARYEASAARSARCGSSSTAGCW